MTVPEPIPDAPPITASSRGSLLTAAHVHSVPAVWVTVNVVVPPAAGMLTTGGATVNAQFGATGDGDGGSCVTVTVRPAIVSVPDRCTVPLWAAMATVTALEPVPELPPVTVRNALLLTAVQPQVAPWMCVTVNVFVSAFEETTIDEGSTLNSHPTVASCVIVIVRPAIVTVPGRAAPVFTDAVTVTDPDPVPALPLVIVRNALLLAAVQLQSAPCVLVTVNVRLPPAAATVAAVGLTSNAQPAASCTIVTTFSAIVTVPERDAPLFDAAVTVTDPEPVPWLPLVTVRNALLLTAAQPQLVPCELLTVNVAAPPLPATVVVTGVTSNAHTLPS